MVQGLAGIVLSAHYYPTYGSSWDHNCDATAEAQCISWFAARSYEYYSLTSAMESATTYAITNTYNPTDVYMYADSADMTGYFDADYGTSGGNWAWTACAGGATYYGSDASHTRDCVPNDVRYNLHYESEWSTTTRKRALACHETGHLFGLLHNTSTSSCMHNTPGTATVITTGERNLINGHY